MTTNRHATRHSEEETEMLRARLQEAEDTLDAIREGAVDALVVKARDKQQIFTLKSADHIYRVLIESMNQGAATITEDGTILYSNAQFATMMGKPLKQVIGTQLYSMFKPKDHTTIELLIGDKKKVSKPSELILELARDTYKAVMISVTSLQKIENNAYMCVVVTDMTERKQAENAKDEFISLASHQLRTPATGVKQYLGMLLEGYAGDLTEDHRVFIKTAYDINDRQLNTISDILKTAQVDSGTYTLQRSHENISNLIDAVLADFRSIFIMRRQKIVCDVDSNIYIEVDPLEISLVISNLVENASKYSPNGTTINIKGHKTKKNVSVEVSDQGVGIGKDDKKRIFDKFTRVSNTMSDTVNGNGLGLYWVNRIVALHGGSVEVESTLLKGSTFKITLPV